MENQINCPSCDNQNTQEIGPVPATNFFAGQMLPELIPGGSLFYCNNCGLRFKSPHIQPDELEILYSLSSLDHWQSASTVRADWRIAKEWILTKFPQVDILDIGCFDGRFFSLLPQSSKFSGIEINPQAAEKARQMGVQILGSDFRSLADCDSDKFDVITAFDVIEHIVDPAGFLKQAVRVVRPGGFVIISTGNALSTTSRLMGSRYYYVANAEHVSFINLQWCEIHAHELGIILEDERKFSHAILNTFYIRLKQIVLNLIYRFFSSFFVWLRRRGLSDKDTKLHPELASYPPNWMTAKDHFIVKFRKQ